MSTRPRGGRLGGFGGLGGIWTFRVLYYLVRRRPIHHFQSQFLHKAHFVHWAKKPCCSRCSILRMLASMRSFFLSIEALKAASTSSRVLFKFVGFILCPFFIYLLQKYEIISTRHVSFLCFLLSDDK